jgi:peptide/nickel transport system substrate-binding protein
MNLKRVAKGLVAFASSLALVFGALGAPAQAANTPTLTIGQVANVTSWDPAQATPGHLMVFYQGVYDNFILRTPDGKYRPNLATKWTVSKDYKSVTLTLRKGVKFTDGTAFNASVAKKNLDAFIKAVGPQTSTMAGATVTAPNATTIKIQLKDPNPDIIYYLATTNSFMVSERALGTAGLKTVPVGSGPYIYDSSSIPGSQIVLKKNPNYWDKSKQKFQTIVFKIMTDTNARLNALISGQVDAALLSVPTSATAKARGLTLHQFNIDWSGLMLLDRDGKVNPAMKDVRVRQAINYALDRETMRKTLLGGNGEITSQIFGKASVAYVKSLDTYYKYDPTRAKQLLASAGYANGVSITMPAISFDPAMQAVVNDYLKAVGINVTWANVPATEYVNAMASKKYEAAWFQLFQGEAWVNFNLAIAPKGARNFFNNRTPLVDNAYKNVLSNPSPANIKLQMTNINREIVKQAWFAPFYRIPQMFFTNSKVTVKPQVQNAIPYLYNFSPTGK